MVSPIVAVSDRWSFNTGTIYREMCWEESFMVIYDSESLNTEGHYGSLTVFQQC